MLAFLLKHHVSSHLIDKDVHCCKRERLTGLASEIPLLICPRIRGAHTQKFTLADLYV